MAIDLRYVDDEQALRDVGDDEPSLDRVATNDTLLSLVDFPQEALRAELAPSAFDWITFVARVSSLNAGDDDDGDQ